MCLKVLVMGARIAQLLKRSVGFLLGLGLLGLNRRERPLMGSIQHLSWNGSTSIYLVAVDSSSPAWRKHG